MVAHLKVDVLLFQANGKYLESTPWNAERSYVDSNYPSSPSLWAGYYEVAKIGNGGRELALIDLDGNIFVAHQDHAEIVIG